MGEYSVRSSRNTPNFRSYSNLWLEFFGISTIIFTISGQRDPGSSSCRNAGTPSGNNHPNLGTFRIRARFSFPIRVRLQAFVSGHDFSRAEKPHSRLRL